MLSRCAAGMFAVAFLSSPPAASEELAFPQIVRFRYEANDSRTGGNFIIWIDRDRLWHGLDQRLYPAARYVEVRHITPSTGSPPITFIEVGNVNSSTPEYYHAAGLIRFKLSNMTLTS